MVKKATSCCGPADKKATSCSGPAETLQSVQVRVKGKLLLV